MRTRMVIEAISWKLIVGKARGTIFIDATVEREIGDEARGEKAAFSLGSDVYRIDFVSTK